MAKQDKKVKAMNTTGAMLRQIKMAGDSFATGFKNGYDAGYHRGVSAGAAITRKVSAIKEKFSK